MDNMIKKLLGYTLGRAIVCLLLGLALLLIPRLALKVAVVVLSLWLLLDGLLGILSALRYNPAAQPDFELVIGIVQIAFAICLLVLPATVQGALPFLLGVLMVVYGATDIARAIGLHAAGRTFLPVLIAGLLVAAIGLVLMLHPSESVSIIVRLCGLLLIGVSVGDLAAYFSFRKNKPD